MQISDILHTFPSYIKFFIASFLLVLSVGYFSGMRFVSETQATTPSGIEENYLGNEDQEDAATMKFKKSKREMLTTLHSHILSISIIFFILGGLVATTSISTRLKSFLMIEPFVSVILTFGGIYIMWKGVTWFKYVVVFSGIVMTLVYVLSVLLILFQLTKKSQSSNKK